MQIIQSSNKLNTKKSFERHILLVSDKGFFKYLNLVVASFLFYNTGVYNFHIFTMDNGDQKALDHQDMQNLMKLKNDYKNGNVEFTVYNLTEEYNKHLRGSVNDPGVWTNYASLRLLAPLILNTIPVILYLDCDILVLDDLSPYFALPEFNKYDLCSATFTDEITDRSYTSFLLVLNLENIRRMKKTNQLIEKFNTVVYPTYDMGVLNDCDLRFFPSALPEPYSPASIGVMHFCGFDDKQNATLLIQQYSEIKISDIPSIRKIIMRDYDK